MILFLYWLACTGAALAQRGAQAPSQTSHQARAKTATANDTLSVNVNLVDLLFTVADKKGKFITNLKKEDFKVYEDDKNQIITNFTS